MKVIIFGLLLLFIYYLTRTKRSDRRYIRTNIIKPIKSFFRAKSNSAPTFSRPNRVSNARLDNQGLIRDKLSIRSLHKALSSISNSITEVFWKNLSPILDQGPSCGSCWSFSAASMFSDRFRIKYGYDITFSPYSLAACCICPYDLPHDMECNDVCGGNYLDVVTNHLVNVGADLDDPGKYICNIRTEKVKGIRSYRVNKYDPFQLQDCTDEVRIQRIEENELLILEELKNNGPVCGLMKICIDESHNFYEYSKGIYGKDRWKCIKDDRFHAIEIVGAGIEKDLKGLDTKYWLCKNSWSTDWGEQGYFKILRGENYLYIESDIWTVEL